MIHVVLIYMQPLSKPSMFHQSIKVRVNNFVQIYNYSYNASTFLLQHNKSTGFFLWSAQLAKLVFPLICHTFVYLDYPDVTCTCSCIYTVKRFFLHHKVLAHWRVLCS